MGPFSRRFEDEGFDPLANILSSVLIYEGAMQLVVAMLNRYKDISFFKRIYLAMTLTDEVYLMEVNPQYGREATNQRRMNLFVHLLVHLVWMVATIVGYYAGDFLPINLEDIEFSATAYFVVVVVEHLLTSDSYFPIILGFLSAIVYLIILGPASFILPSLLTTVILLLFLKKKVTQLFILLF